MDDSLLDDNGDPIGLYGQIYWAYMSEDWSSFRALVQQVGGADNFPTHFLCHSLLQHAALGGRDKGVEVLLETASHSLINLFVPCEGTPLMAAAYDGHIKCVELLLAAGADPNAMDPFGDNALDWAARGKRKGVMEVLRRAGAAPDRPDRSDTK